MCPGKNDKNTVFNTEFMDDASYATFSGMHPPSELGYCKFRPACISAFNKFRETFFLHCSIFSGRRNTN
jgi:hypothetical protein